MEKDWTWEGGPRRTLDPYLPLHLPSLHFLLHFLLDLIFICGMGMAMIMTWRSEITYVLSLTNRIRGSRGRTS